MASLRRTTFVAVFSLFLSLTARVSAQDVEEITTYPPDFNGWQLHVQDGTTSPFPISCGDGQYYSSSDGYVHCCYYNFECVMATRCEDNSIVWQGGSQSDCGDDWRCRTMTVFDEFPDQGPIYTDVFCGQTDWTVSTVYRTIPMSSTADMATSAISTAEPRGDSSPTTPAATSTPTEPTDNDNDDDDDTPEPPVRKSGSNAGLIAGAVVGPVVGLALIAIALWLIRDRIKGWFSSKPDGQQPPQQPDSSAPPLVGPGAYTDSKDIKHAPGGYGYAPPHHSSMGMSATMLSPSELDTPAGVVYELPAPFVENADARPMSQELPADSRLSVSELSPETATVNRSTATGAPSPSPLRSPVSGTE